MQTMLMQASGLTAQCSSRSQPVHNRWQRTCWRLRSSGFRSGTQLQQRVSNGAVCRAFFKLGGQTSESGGVYGAQKRSDYTEDDVEQYFNYMGMLAEEGTYDRLDAVLKAGIHPADILLQWAAQEGDTPKAAELLRAGADPTAKNPDGKTPEELTKDPEILAMLDDPQKAQDFEKDD